MRNMKRLGLLTLAAMTMTAYVGVSSAAAETDGWFTFGASGATLSWTTLEGLKKTVTGQSTECTSAFSGKSESTKAAAFKVAPTFTNCKVAGLTATASSAGCELVFTSTTDASGTHAPVHLENCTNGGITTTVSIPFIAKCVLHVKNQTLANAAHYFNTGGGTDIEVVLTATNVHVEVTESTGACPLTVGTHTNGTLSGKWTVQATGTTIQHTVI